VTGEERAGSAVRVEGSRVQELKSGKAEKREGGKGEKLSSSRLQCAAGERVWGVVAARISKRNTWCCLLESGCGEEWGGWSSEMERMGGGENTLVF